MKLFISLSLLFQLGIQSAVFAQATYIPIGNAKTKQAVITLAPSDAPGAMASSYAVQILKTVEADLNFFELFKIASVSSYPQENIKDAADIKYAEWIKAGIDYMTFSSLAMDGPSKVVFTFHVVGTSAGKELMVKKYAATTHDLKIMAHTIADDLVMAVTGKRGVFKTRIAFVCEKASKKEIYTMSFDGSDIKQVTRFDSISMAPAWSPDGKKLAFSIFNRHSDNTKNIDLFELNFQSGKVSLLSNKKGINSGANYHPNGSSLAYTMSFAGTPTIYILNLETKQSSQLTKSIGFDVDPKFSPDGKQVAFTSTRAGKPMIYVLPTASPGEAKRLTYAGQYNATPSWLPDGRHIIFAGMLEGHFDLFRINLDNDQIDRLTKGEGNNEDPSVSPDGNYLVFSSNRANGKNIWVMSTDGRFAKRLTFGAGQCVAPAWSPYLN